VKRAEPSITTLEVERRINSVENGGPARNPAFRHKGTRNRVMGRLLSAIMAEPNYSATVNTLVRPVW